MTNSHGEPLDFSYLIEMVGDDPAFLAEFFETFIEHTPVYLAEMENALTNENWSKVANHAHKIKPTFIYVGRNDAKLLVEAIENNARNKIALDKIRSDLEKLKLMLSDILFQLKQEKIKLVSKL
ncbi:Hpt domain-containing protein [Pedobacter jeongneungensis]|uniref:Hpt domain-containing protein n=1 Tax=Pedobacter jeongneungensis TaxID=947309 RepID=UPI00046A81DA|nr:Hpt domain-containing protein [Pedobacter jeongneungensis]